MHIHWRLLYWKLAGEIKKFVLRVLTTNSKKSKNVVITHKNLT